MSEDKVRIVFWTPDKLEALIERYDNYLLSNEPAFKLVYTDEFKQFKKFIEDRGYAVEVEPEESSIIIMIWHSGVLLGKQRLFEKPMFIRIGEQVHIWGILIYMTADDYRKLLDYLEKLKQKLHEILEVKKE